MPYETVNHPPHYNMGGVEAMDVIDAWELDFCLGNVLKYIARVGRKPGTNGIEDLKKARWYLDREITDWEERIAKELVK